MQIPELESKRIFLIASKNEELIKQLTQAIELHIKQPTIFTAADGVEALFKSDNVLPHVALLDADLEKTNGFIVAEKLLHKKTEHTVSIILLTSLPEQDLFVDQVVTGQIQFLSLQELDKTTTYLMRALNRISLSDDSHYRIKFLEPNDVLFSEGESAQSVFIVRSGELVATKNGDKKQVELGTIKPGEFVGEMAHINHDSRTATVTALTDCELIEIPNGTLDLVLFSKPIWARALVATLSKRLKLSNNLLMSKQ
jgi:CRP/FNR family cyclic AMP-dependent transcriptional regulator